MCILSSHLFFVFFCFFFVAFYPDNFQQTQFVSAREMPLVPGSVYSGRDMEAFPCVCLFCTKHVYYYHSVHILGDMEAFCVLLYEACTLIPFSFFILRYGGVLCVFVPSMHINAV